MIIKKGLMADVIEQENKRKQQKKLKKKHRISEENVIVVEKSSTPKYIMLLLRTVANVLFYFLAIIGILALIYPEPRTALLSVYNDMLDQLLILIKGGI